LTSFPVDELLAAPAADTGERANAIELRGVSKSFGKSFGDVVALHPLDLDIRDGEFFCLLGPSGCGKTTTLNIIGGFTAPSTGVVRIAGSDVTKRPPNKRPVNTVFQSYALFPHLNVLENVAFGLRMARVNKSEQRTRARESLDLVGLGTFAERPVSQLSGGQAQRVAIARALAMSPSVLLLDEVTSALDPELVGEVLAVIRQLTNEGMTMVIVTHEMSFAREVASRVVFMDGGLVAQEGSAAELLDRPENPRLAAFLRRFRS